MGLAYQTIRGAYERRDRYPLSAAEIAAIPYSTMGFWMTGGLRSVIVMESLSPPDDATWRSADKVLITTQNGLIVSTAGLPSDLRRYEYDEIPVLTLAAIGATGERPTTGLISNAEAQDTSAAFEARFTVGSRVPVTILGANYIAVPVTENIRLPQQHWHAENRYWFRETDGLAIKGLRAYAADAPALNWERFANPAG